MMGIGSDAIATGIDVGKKILGLRVSKLARHFVLADGIVTIDNDIVNPVL